MAVKDVALAKLTVVLFNVAVPEFAPNERVVAPPPMFNVVAVELTKLKVVCVVVTSPPFTAKSPPSTMLPLVVKPPAVVMSPLLATVNFVTPDAEAVMMS